MPVLRQDPASTSSAELEWLARDSQGPESIAAPEINNTLFSETEWIEANTSAFDLSANIGLPAFAPPSQQCPENLQMEDIEGYINTAPTPWEPGDDYITTGAIYQARVQFAARQFKTYPEIFYKRGQAPFIHRHLYTEHTPAVIYDALSCCALYSAKNSDNESLVFGDVSRKARELVERQQVFHSPLDLLASIQALLLYQIIRLLDGDIRLRAEAESNEVTLISWTDQLLSRIQPVVSAMESGSSSAVQNSTIPSSWNNWIFEESCRRTILTSYMLKGVYSFLKVGSDDVSGKVDKLSFTAQTALWSAPSEYHWKEVSKDKNHFRVTLGNWTATMVGAKPADLDELGIMILAVYKGIDITCEWLGRENLARWGLELGTPGTRDSRLE
jgi:hypothetical protein